MTQQSRRSSVSIQRVCSIDLDSSLSTSTNSYLLLMLSPFGQEAAMATGNAMARDILAEKRLVGAIAIQFNPRWHGRQQAIRCLHCLPYQRGTHRGARAAVGAERALRASGILYTLYFILHAERALWAPGSECSVYSTEKLVV